MRLQQHFGHRGRATAIAVDLKNVVAVIKQIAVRVIPDLQTELMVSLCAIEEPRAPCGKGLRSGGIYASSVFLYIAVIFNLIMVI